MVVFLVNWSSHPENNYISSGKDCWHVRHITSKRLVKTYMQISKETEIIPSTDCRTTKQSLILTILLRYSGRVKQFQIKIAQRWTGAQLHFTWWKKEKVNKLTFPSCHFYVSLRPQNICTKCLKNNTTGNLMNYDFKFIKGVYL